MNINFTEINNLNDALTRADIPHKILPLYDGFQIILYADKEMENELDDVVIHRTSHGVKFGLLETYRLNDCEGWETAETVFTGWQKMYEQAQTK